MKYGVTIMSLSGLLALAGAAGANEVVVPGGDGLNVKYADPVHGMAPNSICEVTGDKARPGTRSGLVLIGTDDCNVDDPTGWPGWKREKVIYRTPANGDGTVRPRFGSYKCKSETRFRDVKVRTLRAVYGRSGEFELGHGESVDGNAYAFVSAYGSVGRNNSRPLVSYENAYLNTSRWCLRQKSSIVYRHALGNRNITSAKVSLVIGYGGNGSFALEASNDGTQWHEFLTVTNKGNISVSLPSSVFPAKQVFVRFSGRPRCDYQVANYDFFATFDGVSVPPAAGETFYVDDTGAISAHCRRPTLYDDSYGALVADSGVASFWSASSGWKVSRRRPVPAVRTNEVCVALAANESEAVQIVVTPRQDMSDVRVEPRELKATSWFGLVTDGTIPASAIEVRRVGYVPVEFATDEFGCPGLWPDPLLAQDASKFPVASGVNQPFWITVTVPPGTKKGIYRGMMAVSLKSEGRTNTVDVPLSVEVFGFELPKEMTLQSSFGVGIHRIAPWHRAKTGEEKKRIFERYISTLAAYRISPSRPQILTPPKLTWDMSAGADHPEAWKPVFDWTEWDANLSRMLGEYSFNAFNVAPLYFWHGFGEGFRKPPLANGKIGEEHPAYPILLKRYLTEIWRHLVDKGLDRKAYLYWFDEPSKGNFGNVMEGMAILKETMPTVRRLLTNQPESELLGGPNLWCPLPQYLHSADEASCRKAGDEFWWYLCTQPKAPYFGEFIDRSAAELRQWGWASWKTGITGLLMWETVYWSSSAAYPDPRQPQNPYEDAMGWVSSGPAGTRKPWGNGDGRFLYPPLEAIGAQKEPNGPFIDVAPVPTQRLAMIRDAVEDYEYLSLLKRKNASSPLLAVPPEIQVSDVDFTTRPESIECRRVEIARELERL